MKNLFRAYVVLASIVGVSIILLLFIGMPLKYAHEIWPGVLIEGSPWQSFGDNLNKVLGVAHGWVYAVFVIVAFRMAQGAGWPMGYTLKTLALGTVPFASFWAERRAIRRMRAEHPELA